MKRLLLILFISILTFNNGNAQLFKRNSPVRVEKGLFGKSLNKKKAIKVKEPKKVLKAKKSQERKEKKLKSSYARAVKRSQKRTYLIQTPDVQSRMKQNNKDLKLRNKAKKKNTRSATKKAGKKYN